MKPINKKQSIRGKIITCKYEASSLRKTLENILPELKGSRSEEHIQKAIASRSGLRGDRPQGRGCLLCLQNRWNF
jgi:hypothetical protein